MRLRAALACCCAAALIGCSSGPEPLRSPAHYVVAPAPVYPAAARRLQEQGTVTLRVQVLANDALGFVDLKTSSGSPRLDAAALDAVKRAKYAAATTQSGKRVTSVLLVPISFKLE